MGDNGDHCVHLRGLPWTTTVDDIADFLKGCCISNGKESGVHLTRNIDGRPSGEAFVELESEEDVKQAIAKNKEHIGSRYIDVFKVRRSDMSWVFKQCGINQGSDTAANDCIIRLRGLPFDCSKEEIANFFTGLEIVPNGITILADYNGRTSGDAFVQFTKPESVEKALLKDKETIGHRYVEVFHSNCEELMGGLARMCWTKGGGVAPQGGRGLMRGGASARAYGYGGMMNFRGGRGGMGSYRGGGYMNSGAHNGRYSDRDYMGDDHYGSYAMNYGQGGYGLGGGYGGSYTSLMGRGGHRGGGKRGGFHLGDRFESHTGHSIHMRGLPFSATEEDIAKFFSPISLVNIAIEHNSGGRPSGSADVDFATHEDALEGMKRNKANMDSRYIELFLHSTPSGRQDRFKGSSYGNVGMYGGSGNYTPF